MPETANSEHYKREQIMAYIFPERSEESQGMQESQESFPLSEQEMPVQELSVEESSTQEDAAPVIIDNASTSSSPEASLPPEAQGEPNGGPLGCCLGTILGLFLAFALVTGLSILMANGGTFLTIPVTFLGACLGGYLGWRVGKRVYKEYTPPVVKHRPFPYPGQPTRTKAKRRRQMPK